MVDDKEKRHICTCRFPILVQDKRDIAEGEEMIAFYGIPLDVIEDVGTELPEMEVVDQVSPSGVSGKYMKVTWLKPHTNTRMYEVLGHLMVAGCEDGAESCDIKSIFIVFHPIKEWYERHVIEIK